MIAIPNMSKPKSCQECPAHTFDYGYITNHDGCRILKRAFNVDKLDINPLDEVLPDCPLIEIVHCKDCKWFGIDDGMTYCNVWLRDVERHMFCNYGERRTDE